MTDFTVTLDAELARLHSEIEQLTEQRDALARAVREHNEQCKEKCLQAKRKGGTCNSLMPAADQNLCAACPRKHCIPLPMQEQGK